MSRYITNILCLTTRCFYIQFIVTGAFGVFAGKQTTTGSVSVIDQLLNSGIIYKAKLSSCFSI